MIPNDLTSDQQEPGAKHIPSPALTAVRAVQPLVYLCGAGPGSADLLTLRAARLLATCDVILPDDLVSQEILALASPHAQVILVGKRCGQPRVTQAGIHALMLEHTRSGSTVLRLKSGDPLIFGRAGEEIDFLTAHSIPFEIVPGITTALAVAAALKTPLTDRTAASKLIFATAHHSELNPLSVPWHGAFPPEATLILYMPGRDFTRLSADLIAAGILPTTPVAAVSRGSTRDQQITATTLAALPASAPGPAPLILLIGQAIRLP